MYLLFPRRFLARWHSWRRKKEWRAFQNPCSDRGTTKRLEETRTEDTPRRIHYVTHPTYPAPSGILVVFCQSQIRKIAYVVWASFRTPYSLSLLGLVAGFGFLVSGSLYYNSKRGTRNSKLLNQPSGEADRFRYYDRYIVSISYLFFLSLFGY